MATATEIASFAVKRAGWWVRTKAREVQAWGLRLRRDYLLWRIKRQQARRRRKEGK